MWNAPTEKQLAKLPRLYATENRKPEDKIIQMHFFVGGCDWYIVEYDPDERLFYGFTNLNDPQNAEWGYISYDELRSAGMPVQGRHMQTGERFTFRQPVDRDLHWRPRPFREVWTH